ncbi:sodium:solute symporter [Aureispira anguillae]|uniref:Sodium:solute symporter n=1 Tax=Aureispira anguillae TaxID=2864201 RepID=A0A915YLG2_9BACT|nr:sodium:solute symporter [Aureispira anguillae]BDS14928.1 sodium:solute symporter [Aureispira anguillae]
MNEIDVELPSALSPSLILSIVGGYFLLLLLIAFWTGKKANNRDFFVANRQSPWYLVAFGMIGASLSGVTFISVPGMVGAAYLNSEVTSATNMQFSYMQMVFGYLVGYTVIALVLLPLYYRLNLTSIYAYLEQRFGLAAYKTGAGFFLLSRIIGAAFRLYLVAMVLYLFVFEPWGVPFWVVSLLTIVLIWIYTFKGGIKTIVWTDTLQTLFMLIAVAMTVFELTQVMNISLGNVWSSIQSEGLGQIFFFEGGWSDSNNFFKQFLAGMFIAIVMTGLDQDMMQKNLTCRNIEDAQKNMFSFSIVLVFVNFLFLMLGALLAIYALQNGVEYDRADSLYPTIALRHLPWEVGVVFVIGLVAAAYSSADSALTALTTSFCVDFLGFKTTASSEDKAIKEHDDILDASSNQSTLEEEKGKERTRYLVHIGFSLILFLVIVAFWLINDQSVVVALFKFAGYTYGPLLGLYAFGLFTNKKVKDSMVPVVCLVAPLLTYGISAYSEVLLWGYKFGFELLLVNGLLTFMGLLLITDREI